MDKVYASFKSEKFYRIKPFNSVLENIRPLSLHLQVLNYLTLYPATDKVNTLTEIDKEKWKMSLELMDHLVFVVTTNKVNSIIFICLDWVIWNLEIEAHVTLSERISQIVRLFTELMLLVGNTAQGD